MQQHSVLAFCPAQGLSGWIQPRPGWNLDQPSQGQLLFSRHNLERN